MYSKKKKKKAFVLLEILIAFALVTITVLPFLHYPFENMQKQIDLLFEMELQRAAQVELSNICVQLFENKVDKSLIFGEKKAPHWDTKQYTAQLGDMTRTFLQKTSVRWKSQKVLISGKTLSLVDIQVKYYSLKNKKTPLIKAQTQLVIGKK